MSLLMQALKKAERAKQNSVHEDELEKPSEAYDQILSLSPREQQPALSAAPVAALALEPADGLSLAPLSTAAPEPLAFAAAEPAPEPPQPPELPFGLEAPFADARPAAAAFEAPRQDGARAQPEPPPRPAPRPPPRAKPVARARAPISVDPATIRLAVLCTVLALVVGGFGYWYWRATNGGAGANLPMVPMPLTDAPAAPAAEPGAAQSAAAYPSGPGGADAPPGAGAAYPTDQAAPSNPAAPAPGYEMGARERIEQQQALEMQQQQLQQQQQQQQLQQQQQQQQQAPPAQAQAPRQAPPQAAPPAAPDSADIRVVRTNLAPQLNPALEGAYQAFNSGDTGAARQHYETVLRQEPNNRDALLGMAAVALREGRGPQAGALYLRLLELDPNDGEALAGLIALRQGDPVQGESRLKAILQRAPDAGPVLFALGNLYAKQGRWSDAQQQFFRAYNSTPDNADYAFNLAVGLDRLNQPRLALTYYQRALALAQTRPGAFDGAVLRQRMRELGDGAAVPQ